MSHDTVTEKNVRMLLYKMKVLHFISAWAHNPALLSLHMSSFAAALNDKPADV